VREHLAGVPRFVQHIFYVHWVCIVIVLGLFAGLCFGIAPELAGAGTARILLQAAAGAIFAEMVLSGAYAVADFVGSEALTVPQMARTHGILNAIGFCLTGLLGWLVEKSSGQVPGVRSQ
jgi:hypothetical protein